MKNLDTEYERAEYLTKLKGKTQMKTTQYGKNPIRKKIIHTNEDSILFSDDTGIGFSQTNDIMGEIKIYDDNVTTENKLLVNWRNVFILIKPKDSYIKTLSKHSPNHIAT